MIDRHKALNELKEEQRLREYVRKGLKLYFEQKKIQLTTTKQMKSSGCDKTFEN